MSGITEQELDEARRRREETIESGLRLVELASKAHGEAQEAERRAWDALQDTIRRARSWEATLEELAAVSGLPQVQIRWIVDGIARVGIRTVSGSAWWLSFATDEGFLGGALFVGDTFEEAFVRASVAGANPGGECKGIGPIPLADVPAGYPIDTFLDRAAMEEFGGIAEWPA